MQIDQGTEKGEEKYGSNDQSTVTTVIPKANKQNIEMTKQN